MIRQLDHVAIAVGSLQERLPFYRDHLGLPLQAIEEVSTEQVRVAILGEGAGRIELLEPTLPDSPVGRFLKRRGEGVHHLCFLVDSLEESCRHLEAAGCRLLGGIRSGSEGTRIAFVDPKSAGGILLELREPAREKP